MLYTHVLPSGLVLFQLVVYVLQFLMASFAVRLSHSFFFTSHVKHAHAPEQRGKKKWRSIIRRLVFLQLVRAKATRGCYSRIRHLHRFEAPKSSSPLEGPVRIPMAPTQYFRHYTPQLSLVFVIWLQLCLSVRSITNVMRLSIALIKIVLFRTFYFLKVCSQWIFKMPPMNIEDRSFHFSVKQERLEKYIKGSMAG